VIVYSAFMGRPLRRFGSGLFDAAGRQLVRLNPAMAGYLSSKAAEGQDVSGAIADLYSQFMPEQSNAGQNPRPQERRQ